MYNLYLLGFMMIVALLGGIAGGQPPYQTDLVGWYPFDDGSGTSVSDQSGFGAAFALTARGPLSWVTDGDGDNGLQTNVVDVTAQARLDGPGPNKIMNEIVASQQYTVRVTFSPSITGADSPTASSLPMRLFTFSNGATCPDNQDLVIGVNNQNGNLVLVLRPLFAGGCTGTISSTPLNKDQKYTVVVTFDGTQSTMTYRTWVDGTETTRFDTPKPSGWTLHSVYPIHALNEEIWNRQFHGTIYDIAIWRRTLSPAEVNEVFSPSATTTAPATAADTTTAGATTSTTTTNPATTTSTSTTTGNTTTPASSTTVPGPSTTQSGTPKPTAPATTVPPKPTAPPVSGSTTPSASMTSSTSSTTPAQSSSGQQATPSQSTSGTPKPKKKNWTLIIVIVVVVIVLIVIVAVVCYFVFFKKSSSHRPRTAFEYEPSDLYRSPVRRF